MDTISNQPVSQETVTPLESAPPSFRLTPALFGGLGAGIVGGVLWGLIVSWTGYELGYAAWGLGLLVGFTVVFTAKGARGLPFQIIASISSILGILIGKYFAFVSIFKDVAETELGVEIAQAVSAFSIAMIRVFVENITTILGGYDILWVVLAVVTAWRMTGVRKTSEA
ncbi:MAG: hypothetical protein A3H06_01870 [Candidatus Colwellbacteria bacterium RIFCSPLOWO2_12_FULL_44_13]|uniref:Uncharacterized protein n=3 Tax=Candidatus Colwelliibacteriota TaxID=1817904 RepID=A0A1G1Z5G8_9BACT|nr:MAG: hypothetical protein A3F24_01225 [Candidatus Colwellbacteria bacterium RIFCSPHIGHO2_12_FULL_44_17]OGY59276.1 MAG: hypothetical protein A3I31_01360 [Candidatus Colwellbacteria bacterium RIFCSPLOWO2_02_FULL_44_20b]OGY61416.1 MAG: hypothetical protein A3H06_01870 [Candidatus Colwellbacteria bacterium RIFCSPLOWO2_12_FULL_44_13]